MDLNYFMIAHPIKILLDFVSKSPAPLIMRAMHRSEVFPGIIFLTYGVSAI